MLFTDAMAAALAVVAVALAVATAHGPVFPCADLRTARTLAGLIARAAFGCYRKIAEPKLAALNAGNTSATAADDDLAGVRWGVAAGQRNTASRHRKGWPDEDVR